MDENPKYIQELHHRFDRLEEKLDRSMQSLATHEADIGWVKGYIKMTISLMIAIVGSIAAIIVKLLHV